MVSKEQLMDLLEADGHNDICEAVASGRSNSLSSDKKDILVEYGRKLQKTDEGLDPRVSDALLEVSTSGWSKESESTIPGPVVSASERW